MRPTSLLAIAWLGAIGACMDPLCTRENYSGVAVVSLGEDGALGPDTARLWVGDSVPLGARAASYPNIMCGDLVFTSWDHPEKFTMASSVPAVATMSDRGLVVAHGPGETLLTAASEGVKSIAFRVTVFPAISELRVEASPTTVRIGDTVTVTVTAIGTDGHAVTSPIEATRYSGPNTANGPWLDGVVTRQGRFVPTAAGTFTVVAMARRSYKPDMVSTKQVVVNP